MPCALVSGYPRSEKRVTYTFRMNWDEVNTHKTVTDIFTAMRTSYLKGYTECLVRWSHENRPPPHSVSPKSSFCMDILTLWTPAFFSFVYHNFWWTDFSMLLETYLDMIGSNRRTENYTVNIKRRGRVVNTPASYSGISGFKSRPRVPLAWLSFSWFSSFPRRMPG
jgi:hypothetical protein